MAKWPPDDETTEPKAAGTAETETLQVKKDRLAAFLTARFESHVGANSLRFG